MRGRLLRAPFCGLRLRRTPARGVYNAAQIRIAKARFALFAVVRAAAPGGSRTLAH